MNRREFLRFGSLAAAGGTVWLQGVKAMAYNMGGGSTGWGGGSVIDPPPGASFSDPVQIDNISKTPGIVQVELEMKVAPANINGTTANLLTYNGAIHGPTIRVKKGDTLRVRLKNSLPGTGEETFLGYPKYDTNLHTHGLHVSPSGNSDNIFLDLKPGDTFDYEFDLSKQEAGTLNFYHPHLEGAVAEQMWGGLSGALVVEDGTDVLSGYETHLLILKDIALSGADPAPYTTRDYTNGKEGIPVMVNGQVNPVLPIRPGQVQRWRILNASTARFYKLGLENHTMYLVGTESGLVDKPYAISQILLSPGERIDLLVKADQPAKSYRLRSLPYNRGNNAPQTVTLLTLSYGGVPTTDVLPAAVNPDAARLNINTFSLPRRRLALSLWNGKGLINGQAAQDGNPYTINSRVGTYEVWEINNMSGMDHPFHQHVNAAQVLSISGGDSGYASLYSTIPAFKDTTIVPRMGRLTMLVPVQDFTGTTVFHCHILEHEDIGMLGVWNIT